MDHAKDFVSHTVRWTPNGAPASIETKKPAQRYGREQVRAILTEAYLRWV